MGDQGLVSDVIRAPRGTTLTCANWEIEAVYRMVQNNLDPEVAEKPGELIVYGGLGKAARNRESLQAILATLRRLKEDETMLVQSGKPVGVVRTHTDAPRVIIANSNLVPKWATWDEFRRLDALGLMMYGQMTAGSWIYIGTQGILQGTYETFAACAAEHFNGTLAGKLVVTAGLGGMGGAQPLAVTMNRGAALCIEVDESRIDKRIHERYCDRKSTDLDEALAWLRDAQDSGEGLSVGLLGNAAEIMPELLRRGIVPDVVTDQTSAHDPLNGYYPAGMTIEEADQLRDTNAEEYLSRVGESIRAHVEAMVELKRAGAVVFDYGNNIRAEATDAGYEHAYEFKGFVPEYIRPLFCDGKGPFRWVALSGDEEDIARTDRAIAELFPEDEPLLRWLDMAAERVAYQGLPSRICWLGYGDRAKAGLKFNEMVASGELSAPIVIGRDHLDCGSVASPNRETEAMADGSDAVSDWPLLNFALNAIGGATWVSFHQGGGVGMGYSQHAGMVVVADGTPEAAARIERVLTYDPAMGIFRHADAGYSRAKENAEKFSVDIPMR